VLACQTCNLSRGGKLPLEFFAYLKLIADKAPEIEARRAYMRIKMRGYRARKKVGA
jgi:hypothetical protein